MIKYLSLIAGLRSYFRAKNKFLSPVWEISIHGAKVFQPRVRNLLDAGDLPWAAGEEAALCQCGGVIITHPSF